MSGDVTAAAREFKLSITRALADQLADALDELQPALLTANAIDALETRPGIYELFVDGERVYVGKASRSLPTRLRRHLRKLSGRTNISLDRVGFVCLYVDEDLEAAAPEKMLIARYTTEGSAAWNNNGFGNNDPGRQRDQSAVARNHFDAIHPINLDLTIELPAGVHSVRDLMTTAQRVLPYTFRIDRAEGAKRAYEAATVDIAEEPVTARDLLRQVVGALPEGWQVTRLPGYLILYPESRTYASALSVWRKVDGLPRELPGPAKLAEPGDVEVEDQPDNAGG